MTLRKTILRFLIFGLVLSAGSGAAIAQDPTTTPEATTEPTVQATVEPTVEPTTDATVEATTEPTVESTETPMTGSGDASAGSADGTSTSSIAEAFASDTPNPQPSEPLTPVAETDDEGADAGAADEVQGQTELAFTGPDTRIVLAGLVLLGAGSLLLVAGRRQDPRMAAMRSNRTR